MDMSSRIYWGALWSCCLLGFVLLSPSADAATRKYVGMPAAQQAATSGVPAKVGGDLQFTGQPMTGEYIPATGTGTKGVPMKIIPRTDFSIGRMLNHAKGGMKSGALGIAASVALGMMLDEIDGMINDLGQPVRMKPDSTPAGGVFWCYQNNPANCTTVAPNYGYWAAVSPAAIANRFIVDYTGTGQTNVYTLTSITSVTASTARISYDRKFVSNGAIYPDSFVVHKHGTCPANSTYDPAKFACFESKLLPLDDADLDQMINFAAGQNAVWLQGLLKDVCAGSPSPGACFNEMKERSALTGPATVAGPSTTKTTNTVTPSGVMSQTSTTTNTTYNIKYGPNYYDYSKTTQITTTTDGQPVSDSTESEPDEVREEQPAEEEKPEEEEEEIVASPCAGTGCDGPAYEDQYTPTDETKEEHLDSYADRAANIPIILAVSGLFDVSASGNCPVWSYQGSADILGMSMPIDIVFDYLCLPWFTQYGPWIRAVIYLVCVAFAIRIALL